ncbi:CatA-like O-acetyltransferase [Salinibacterium xinjiangense]
MLPFAVQIHHASADKCHTDRLINELHEFSDASARWLA